METINNMRKVISDLENSLVRLKHEVINLPFSDFRDALLSYVEVALYWENVNDLLAIKETMLLALGMIDQVQKPYAKREIKNRLNNVREAIDRILNIYEGQGD